MNKINKQFVTPAVLAGTRGRLGMTQEQLAHEMGVSFCTVNRWEKGKSKMSPLAIESLKRVCALRMVEIF